VNRYLDAEKALEAILYVSRKTNDLFHIVKTLYYADKLHLENYGRLITGDYYVKMDDGPVPSGAYDLIKFARKDEFLYEEKIINVHPENAIQVKGKTTIVPLREPNLDVLSESDIECLDVAIGKYAQMDFSQLWNLVHEEKSYQKAKKNQPIALKDIIILDVSNGKEVLEYLDA
jgi:hypothetical protein